MTSIINHYDFRMIIWSINRAYLSFEFLATRWNILYLFYSDEICLQFLSNLSNWRFVEWYYLSKSKSTLYSLFNKLCILIIWDRLHNMLIYPMLNIDNVNLDSNNISFEK